MKRITLLLILFVTTLSYAQVPTTSAPTPPARNAVDVISVYGGDDNSYSDITGTDFTPYWSQPTPPWVAPNPAFDVMGNNALQYQFFNYQGIILGSPQNVSGMESLHIDVWTNGNAANVSLISPGNENAYAISSVPGAWQSIDIPMSAYTVPNLNDIQQIKIDGGTGGTVFIDNIYFFKTPLTPGDDATLSDLQVDGTTIAGFIPDGINYTVDLVVGTTTAPTVTAVLSNPAATITSITQAPSVPGDATVVVTSQNGNVTKTYTVSFTATQPNASPVPQNYGTHLAIIQDIADNTPLNNFWEPNDFFGAAPTLVDLDPTATVNKAARLNLSVGWGGTIINNGVLVTTDASIYDTVHFDYFIPSSVAAGSLGHQFYLDLISRTSGNNAEAFYGFGPVLGGTGSNVVDEIIVFDTWQSVDIPMSVFVGKGFNSSNFFQFKIGANSDLNTQLGYFDNIYFYDSSTLLSIDEVDGFTFTAFPNPSKDKWNISSTDTVVDAIKIYDLSGKLVIDQKVDATEVAIDASILTDGIYVAKVISAHGIQNIKLIKK